METKSFKQMIQAGEVKRADAMKVRLEDIHEEPGFNLRLEDADFQASIAALADYIAAGGIFPPLEVRPRPGGGVFLVDGHRRRRALIALDQDGRLPRDKEGEAWVAVVAFTGNDADRTARIITSAEGRALKPLEVALGYKRLAAFGLSPDDIAAKVGKTRQHVDQLLVPANSNTDVQKMVQAGDVSAAVAVKVARQHGENAGQVLQRELEKAKAVGKGKVTDGTMAKKLPAKVLQGVADEVDAFVGTLTTAERTILAEIEGGQRNGGTVMVDGRALLSLLTEHAKVQAARQKQAEKARQRAEKAAQGVLG